MFSVHRLYSHALRQAQETRPVRHCTMFVPLSCSYHCQYYTTARPADAMAGPQSHSTARIDSSHPVSTPLCNSQPLCHQAVATIPTHHTRAKMMCTGTCRPGDFAVRRDDRSLPICATNNAMYSFIVPWLNVASCAQAHAYHGTSI